MVRQNSQIDVCVILLLSLLVTACGDDNDSPTGPSQNTPTGSSSMGLGLSFNGLQRLGSDFVYEGWILVDGSPVSTGTFRVRADGSLSQRDFPVDEAALSSATKFILSIEPSPDSDPAPSGTKYLAGDFAGKQRCAFCGGRCSAGERLRIRVRELHPGDPFDGRCGG